MRASNPSAAVAFQNNGASVQVLIDGVDMTDQAQAPNPAPDEHCLHCSSLPCDLDGLDECLKDEGNSLAANGSYPRHI